MIHVAVRLVESIDLSAGVLRVSTLIVTSKALIFLMHIAAA